MSFEPSNYQKEIFNYVEKEKGSLFIEATAGSGKTTTLIEMAKKIDARQAIFLAFNRHIADELKAKLPPRMTTLTLHALGKQEWEHALGTRVRIDKNKVDKIIDDKILKNRRWKFHNRKIWKLRGVIKDVVGRAKGNAVLVQGAKRHIMEGTQEDWFDLIEMYEDRISDKLNLDFFEVETANSESSAEMDDAKILIWEICEEIIHINGTIQTTIDFDDMLYFPFVFGGDFFELDYIFCDEVQDFNPLQTEIVKMCVGPQTRIFGVGDSRQAIYQWRGADSEAVNNFIEAFKCKTRDLPVSYRCPKSVVKLAQKYNPKIQEWDKADDGFVNKIGGRWESKDFTENDFILSRNNAPVLAMALHLINDDVQVQFIGKDISSAIERVIKRINEPDKKKFTTELNSWYQAKYKRLQEKVRPTELTELIDTYFCLRLLLSKLKDGEPVTKCLEVLAKVFNGTKGVRLSTVHRSKGLEADNVYIMDFDKFDPLKDGKCDDDESEDMNLAYVGITRAKKQLFFIDSPQWFRSKYYTEDGKTKRSEVDFESITMTKGKKQEDVIEQALT